MGHLAGITKQVQPNNPQSQRNGDGFECHHQHAQFEPPERKVNSRRAVTPQQKLDSDKTSMTDTPFTTNGNQSSCSTTSYSKRPKCPLSVSRATSCPTQAV